MPYRSPWILYCSVAGASDDDNGSETHEEFRLTPDDSGKLQRRSCCRPEAGDRSTRVATSIHLVQAVVQSLQCNAEFFGCCRFIACMLVQYPKNHLVFHLTQC